MSERILGGVRVRIVGGERGDGAGAAQTVVLLHGFGARGDDLVPLAHFLGLPAGTRYVFPEGPSTLPGVFGDLRAWWPIDVEKLERALDRGPLREPTALDPDRLGEGRERVSAFLGAVEEELEVAPEQTILGGFSQGAMVALDAALHCGRQYAALVLLSCTLLSETAWRRLAQAKRGTPVFQSHGRSDPLLHFDAAVRLRDLLGEAGLRVEWHEFDGGHDVPAEIQRAMGAFIIASAARAR